MKKFSFQSKKLLVLDTNDEIDDIDHLATFASKIRRYACDEAASLKGLELAIDIIRSGESEKFDSTNRSEIREIIADTLKNSRSLYLSMHDQEDHELITCQLNNESEQPYWQVIRSNNMTVSQFEFLINELTKTGIINP